MAQHGPIEFKLLGPIEARAGDRALPLGGTKQRTLLALLVLRSDEVVPLDRLIDELWGDQPPPSAPHTVEGYVSRLRALLTPYGPTLTRRGSGYVLQLTDALLDVHRFEELREAASLAAHAGDHERAASLANEALALWRGPALVDIELQSEAERLDELRLRALETRIDADLALGRHEDVVGELRRLVDEHGYREHLVAQLMVALYRSGRQAEALETYEATRRALADELGLQPTTTLQRLSGEIVRQDPRLAVPGQPVASPAQPPRRGRRSALLGVAGVTAAAGALAFVLAGTADINPLSSPTPRVALVLPFEPEPDFAVPVITAVTDGLHRSARELDVDTTIILFDEDAPRTKEIARAVTRLRDEEHDLVILPFFSTAEILAPTLAALPGTHVVLLDTSLRSIDVFGKLPKATGVRFADEHAAYLVGYLSGLMEARDGPRLNRERVVSAIGGVEGVPAVDELMRGFGRGVRRALPGTTILTAYSNDFLDRSRCAAIANEHIDAGADIVFSPAGRCGLGALSVVGIRGVWGVGVDGDNSHLGAHVLASTEKQFDEAVLLAVRSFVQGTLAAGQDIVLGLDEDAVGVTGISPQVPAAIRLKVAQAAEALQQGREP